MCSRSQISTFSGVYESRKLYRKRPDYRFLLDYWMVFIVSEPVKVELVVLIVAVIVGQVMPVSRPHPETAVTAPVELTVATAVFELLHATIVVRSKLLFPFSAAVALY